MSLSSEWLQFCCLLQTTVTKGIESAFKLLENELRRLGSSIPLLGSSAGLLHSTASVRISLHYLYYALRANAASVLDRIKKEAAPPIDPSMQRLSKKLVAENTVSSCIQNRWHL